MNRIIPKGAKVQFGEHTIVLANCILEGHRFAVTSIAVQTPVLSWGRPFGVACQAIKPGDYVCNEKVLRVLKERKEVTFPLPSHANFVDRIGSATRLRLKTDSGSFTVPHTINESTFEAADQIELLPVDQQGFFMGYERPAGR